MRRGAKVVVYDGFVACYPSNGAWAVKMSEDTIFSLDKAAGENEVAFDYVKAPDFRIVWADGVIGSVTPRGLIHAAIYAERVAIPRRQVFELSPEGEHLGKLGREVLEKQVSRGSVVREMAVDLMMTAESAEGFGQWLLARVAELRDAEKNMGEKK